MSTESEADFVARMKARKINQHGDAVVSSQDYHRLHHNPMWRGMHTGEYHVNPDTLDEVITTFVVKSVTQELS